ncbi:ABC-type transport auxiliary lipoprotein family protein [Candidatus Latescibacterota bacterium]
MKKRYILLYCMGVALTALSLLSSCSWLNSRLPTKNYYILSYTPVITPPVSSQRPYQYALQVGDFRVQSIFNRQNILYRFSAHQIQYYELEQWAVRPTDMITNLVFEHLEASGLTNRVGIDFYDTRPDFRIEGTVDAIEKYDAGDIYYAHLAMSMKMLRTSDGEQVWEYTFDQRRQVYQPEMVYTVQAMSSIFQNHMDIVVNQLDSLFISIDSGTTFRGSTVITPQQPAPADSTDNGIDESGFEIIPEKPKDD